MRRLFIQFYLLLIGCFTLAILLVGVVYQVTAERAGDRYLERMMQGSLGLLTGELARTPPERWPDRLAEQSSQFTLPLKIGELVRQPLASEDQAFLAAGNIVIVEEDDTFLQRIPDTDRVLIVGPVPYLSYLHELHWVDVGLLLVIGLSLGLPILLWLRPTGAACSSWSRPHVASAMGISPAESICHRAAVWPGWDAPSIK